MLGTTKKMDRPYSGGSVHADAQCLLYSYSRGVDSGSLASISYHRRHHYRSRNRLSYLEVQT